MGNGCLVREPDECLTGGWRSNVNRGNLSYGYGSDFNALHDVAKTPDRGTVRRSPGGFALIPGCGARA